jgi:RNA polymerase sigma factor (sigma-70 family)
LKPVRQTGTIAGVSDEVPELVRRACAGDREAFDRLHAQYERAIVGFVRVRLTDDDLVQDLTQEIWLQVWQKLSTYDPSRASFVAFVKYWAGVMLLRAYERRDRRRAVEVLVPEHTERQAPESSETSSLAAVYHELLAATFSSSSPPHQLVAFGFIKCLGWTPRRVATELSDASLEQCQQRLEQEYLDQSQLPDAEVGPAFEPLRRHLQLLFADVVSDPRTQSTYPALMQKVTGETVLREYYTGDDPAADLTQWWYAVYRRVRGEVQRRADGPLFRLASTRVARKVAARGT